MVPSNAHVPILPRPQAFRLRAAAPAMQGFDAEAGRVLSALFAQEALTIAQARRISRFRYEICRSFIERCTQAGLVQTIPAQQPAGAIDQKPACASLSGIAQRDFILPAKEQSVLLRQRALAHLD